MSYLLRKKYFRFSRVCRVWGHVIDFRHNHNLAKNTKSGISKHYPKRVIRKENVFFLVFSRIFDGHVFCCESESVVTLSDYNRTLRIKIATKVFVRVGVRRNKLLILGRDASTSPSSSRRSVSHTGTRFKFDCIHYKTTLKYNSKHSYNIAVTS